MDIASRLKELRAAAKMSQQYLAAKSGLSISVITKMEAGKNRDPRAATLVAIAAALGVTLDELVKAPHERGGEPKPRGGKKT